MAMQGQGCGIAMPDSYIEPAGQVDFRKDRGVQGMAKKGRGA
jgi:hypothetical protein